MRYALLAIGLLLLTACSQRTTLVPAPSRQAPIPPDKQIKLKQFTSPSPPPIPSPSVVPPSQQPLISPLPTGKPSCALYSPYSESCNCQEIIACVYPDQNGQYSPYSSRFCIPDPPLCRAGRYDQCHLLNPPYNMSCPLPGLELQTCKLMCWAKPVIYLYPTVPQLTTVTLDIPGKITVSDPLYTNGGWQNILVLPSGALLYGGKQYPYLYYETEVAKTTLSPQGIIVPKEYLESALTLLTAHVGLVASEQKDFMAYWLPRLSQYNAPYLRIGILDQEEKQQVDNVFVFPRPDTRIEVLFTFTPLSTPRVVQPLQLPEKPPKRVGFTMVEWGGGIIQ